MGPADCHHGAGGFLPYGRHEVDEDDVAAVVEVLRSGSLTGGPAIEEFEAALAAVVGARDAVACSSGTAGLHLAARAVGAGPADLAVVPAVTFVASANAARLAGAEVTLADVDADTGLAGSANMEQALSVHGERAAYLCPVHLNGQAAPVEAIGELARARGLAVIEDGCHALGTRYQAAAGEWGHVGDCRFSDMTVFSFHPVKTVAMGEGGAVTTNDPALARRLRELRNHGLVREPGRLRAHGDREADGSLRPGYAEMQELGYNYRASDLHCALGASQLTKLDRFAARRQALMRRYDEALAPLAPAVTPVARVGGCEPVLHLYAVLVDFAGLGRPRARVMEDLAARGIGTQVHYLPLHRQPYYRERYGELALPGAERYHERVLSLPFFPAMRDEDVDRVVDALRKVLGL